jgi:lactoylglutathione lyase
MSTAVPTKTISHVSVISVHVTDQNEALRFFTDALGFEKRMDMEMGEGMRWLTVAPAGSTTEFTLVTHDAGAPIGGNTGIILETQDLDAAYRELSGRGVRFTQQPVRHSWGGWAEFVDQDGNSYGIHSS